MTNICIIATIIIYLVAMLLVGFAYSKSNNDSTDFYLGGRKMGPLVTAMSAEASDMSSWLLMGMPGLAYLSGIASPGWTAIGLALGTWLNWLIVARRLRRYSANLEAITVPQFLSLRFHDQRNLLNALGAVIIIVFFVPYTASGFAACGKLFHSLFGVDYMAAMVVSACVIVGYTILGGFRAVTTTDLIQSIVMSLALVAVLVYGIGAAGGWDAVVTNAQSLTGYLTMMASHNAAEGTATSYSLLDIVSTMAWGLGYFGMPQVLVRFLSIRSSEEIKKSRIIATTWCVISLACGVCIGLVGRAMMPTQFATQAAAENIFIVVSQALLPSFMCGIVVSGIFAASMSSSSSYMIIGASAVGENIFRGLLHRKATDRQVMMVARITLLVMFIFGIVVAFDQNSSIFQVVSYAWAGLGASFGPLMLTSLYWRRTNKYGAIAGMLSGTATVLIWHNLVKPLGGIFAIYELLPAFLFSLAACVVVSLATPAPGADIEAEFEAAK